MINPTYEEPTYKIILLGNSGVGKTCIAKRWTQNLYTDGIEPTLGSANYFKEVSHNDQIIKISLWDTAGQEQFRSIAPIYVRGSHCAIIAVSSIDFESMHSVSQWKELLDKDQENPIPAILAITKIDLEPTYDLEQSIEQIKDKFKYIFYVSAMNGSGIEDLFVQAAILAREFGLKEKHEPIAAENTTPVKDSSYCC
ncbi:small GTP-binding protein, putative [Trichomonas vaginalis G3]|uniref:Small GTP-binding protein, putative n=1 Tax=Trichomonas vaginalis (strain ATCC PRA-98 / G3) TaxID=412133 RepID=A2F731_TRIV3|nr:GTPase protein [Trichomonas vaginalis G3]EAX99268.1 small GTP-binding protein, putative [Trichomonas vaginalis G3]KAI5524934.1 GTPase protein [Trichomonas vaginalis G3]|eukprot:XP_001312198.1 small GTP-binding protein [Trichomonas vaginalis G3]